MIGQNELGQTELEVSLVELCRYLRKRIWIVAAVTVLCVLVSMVVTALFLPAEYTTDTRIYVLSRAYEDRFAYSDFQISDVLLEDYAVLITGKNVTKQVAWELNLDIPPAQIESMIQVSAPGNTHVLQISVTDTDAQRAADIANCVREIASSQIQNIMDVDTVKLVYEAEKPLEKSGPSMARNGTVAGMLGLIFSLGGLLVAALLDDTIRSHEDVQRYLGLSVLAAVPVSKTLLAEANQEKKRRKAEKLRKITPGSYPGRR